VLVFAFVLDFRQVQNLEALEDALALEEISNHLVGLIIAPKNYPMTLLVRAIEVSPQDLGWIIGVDSFITEHHHEVHHKCSLILDLVVEQLLPFRLILGLLGNLSNPTQLLSLPSLRIFLLFFFL
jgi:hypothetical protein